MYLSLVYSAHSGHGYVKVDSSMGLNPGSESVASGQVCIGRRWLRGSGWTKLDFTLSRFSGQIVVFLRQRIQTHETVNKTDKGYPQRSGRAKSWCELDVGVNSVAEIRP